MDSEDRPLQGLVFCCTAVVGLAKTDIMRQVRAMGAVYQKNLTRDVTHLVVGSRDTEKFQYVVQRRPDVVLLTPEAVADVFGRWQRVEENLDVKAVLHTHRLATFAGLKVSITNPRSETDRSRLMELIEANGGVYAPDLTRDVTHLVSSKRTGRKYEYALKWAIPVVACEWVELSAKRQAMLDVQYFGLDLTADKIGAGAVLVDTVELVAEPKPNPVVLKKNDQVWNSMLKSVPVLPAPKSADTLLAIDSFAPVELHEEEEPVAQEPVEQQSAAAAAAAAASRRPPRIFTNYTFSVYGFGPREELILEDTIRKNGGHTVGSGTVTGIDLLVVNSELDRYDLPAVAGDTRTVTEWFIERCLHKKQFVLDAWGMPVAHRALPGFKDLTICISGYSGVELLHLERLVRLLGATYQPVFVRDRDLLVSTMNSNKFAYARAWKVPIVNEKWLWKCAETGVVVGLDDAELVIDGKAAPGRTLHRRAKSIGGGEPANETTKTKNTSKDSVSSDLSNLSSDMSSDLSRLMSAKRKVEDSGRPSSSRRKLIGRATVSNLSNSLAVEDVTATLGPSDPPPPPASQVGYVDPDSQRDHMKLMEALGGKPVDLSVGEESMTPAVDLGSRVRPRRNLRS